MRIDGKTYRISETVFSKVIRGRMHIMQSSTDYVRELNETASFVWKRIEKNMPLQTIVNELIREFDISEPQALKDVLSFVHTYIRAGILVRA